jgi:glycosyltransferase involved in cell wall biosynthesis
MMKKVLVFFPHNPYPPRTGAHKRCVEMLGGLKEIGCEVTLLSSTLSSETKWERSSIEVLNADFGVHVHVYEGTMLDLKFRTLVKNLYRTLKRNPPINSLRYSPPGMYRWFRGVFGEMSPDIVIMNYAYWDKLLSHRMRQEAVCVIDTYDLLTLNAQMRQSLQKYLSISPSANDKIDERILEEDYFDKTRLVTDNKEFLIYDKYDYTITISPSEADIIRENIQKTKVLYIPMTHQVPNICNSYSGQALFPTGPNPFNIQGYLYFVKKVLPMVRRRAPSFCLEVTGSICKNVASESGIVLRGFVPSLKAIYKSSKFLVCPILGKTGQQIKIVEAMAHGVPVIALRNAAGGSPIEHGVNGFVANNAEEFSDYVVQLWKNKRLCRRLGRAARNTIAAGFSRSRLLEGLSLIINSQ